MKKRPLTKKNVVKIQTFLRLCAVRLRLRNDCGLENLGVLESQVLRSVSQWYSPDALGSPATASHCGSHHRGFRRPRCHQMATYSAPLSSAFRGSFSSKWFRGIRVNRLALNLFAPSFSTNAYLMPSWCIYHVHIAWIQKGKNEWSQWVLSFQAQGSYNQRHRVFLHPDAAPLSTTVRKTVFV